jgi:vitamin B12/bleomycin/antimicrobial peptide transport system ATP-binding/permease protein
MVPEPENVEETRRQAGLSPSQPVGARIAHAFRLLSRYFVSHEWKSAWALLIAYFAFNLIDVYFQLWFNRWDKKFYDTIEHRAFAVFGAMVAMFIVANCAHLLLGLLRSIVEWTISIRWRRFLTGWYLDRWFNRNRFYEIERLRLIDNPDQRIAEDVQAFSALGGVGGGHFSLVVICINLITNVVSAFTFGALLMQTARPIAFSLFGHHYSVPGDMLWYATAYAMVGTVAITWIGRPFVRRMMRQQHYEANFRANLIHIRRNSEQIAFARSKAMEERGLRGAFSNIVSNWFQLMWANLGLNIGNGLFMPLGSVIPLFVTAPRYFAGEISFGDVMAAQGAFMTFAGTLSYFISAYPAIATQVANINRLKGLDDAIDQVRPWGIDFDEGRLDPQVRIVATGLSLNRPHGEPLISIGDWTVRDGERWVIEGPSGAGKTTLLRAVAGLWPDGHGGVTMIGRNKAMLVPQRLYMPIGTLKESICLPDRSEAHDDATIAALLEQVGLAVHMPAMHQIRIWQEELSPGEQQRVALARILLHRPELLILDEATSALDIGNATHFHELLLETMPHLTLVSIVHNDLLRPFYTHQLRVADGTTHSTRIGQVA